MSSISTQAEQAGREVHQSEWLDLAARIGLITHGLFCFARARPFND